MNEKLEKEIQKYTLERYPIDALPNITMCAEHFYNLALQDVRKELKKHKRLLSNESKYSSYANGRLDEVKDNLSFIDNLTK